MTEECEAHYKDCDRRCHWCQYSEETKTRLVERRYSIVTEPEEGRMKKQGMVIYRRINGS